MDRDAIRSFARRDRTSVAALRRDHWVRLYRERGPAAPWHAAQALRGYMRAIRPGWPTEADRQDDVRHHIELKRKLDRTAHAVARR